jgi:polyisoprenoid-binding protein YceI
METVMKRSYIFLSALLGLGLLFPAAAEANVDTGRSAQSFKLVPTGTNRVTFESDAPIESIVGITSAVSGEIVVRLDNPKSKPSARVVVELDKVKTGVAKRDSHMRSADFLNTSKYPKAEFVLQRVVVEGSLRGKSNVKATLYGKFSLHGVTRNVSVDVRIGHRKATPGMAKFGIKGDVLRVKGSFFIEMSDYGIEVPSKLGAKVSNTVEISLALTGYTG